MLTTMTSVLADRSSWGPGGGWGNGYGPGGGNGPGPWLIVPILWGLLWLGVAIAAVTALWRRATGDTRGARDALAQRYATGDIDEQEYLARRAVLRRRR